MGVKDLLWLLLEKAYGVEFAGKKTEEVFQRAAELGRGAHLVSRDRPYSYQSTAPSASLVAMDVMPIMYGSGEVTLARMTDPVFRFVAAAMRYDAAATDEGITVVIAVDVPGLVPQFKERESERRRANPVEKYSLEYIGMLRDEIEKSECTLVLDPTRLMESKETGGRQLVMDYIRTNLTRIGTAARAHDAYFSMLMTDPRFCYRIVLDGFNDHGVCTVLAKKRGDRTVIISSEATTHQHGEAEQVVADYAIKACTAGQTVVACTVDQDLLEILAIWAAETRCAPGRLYWAKDSYRLIDVGQLILDSGLSPASLFLLGLMAGNDFVLKSEVAHWVGPKSLVAAISGIRARLPAPDSARAQVLRWVRQTQAVMMRQQGTHVADNASDADIRGAFHSNPGKRKLRPLCLINPTDDGISYEELIERILFVFFYWTRTDGRALPAEPSPSVPASSAAAAAAAPAEDRYASLWE